MSQTKPLILVTNDDGYKAKGIKALTQSLIGLGEIVVVAPDGPRSGMSSAITTIQPLRYYLAKKDIENDVTVYACTGTPVDCVKLAISEILDRKPDLVVSGINHGSNASICVIYSGTMGAAIEGCLYKIPSIGFSLLDHHFDADFSHTTQVTRTLSEQVMKTGLPKNICLNVNIPHSSKELKGVKVCTQAPGQFVKEIKKSADGADNEIYWLTGYFENDTPNDTSTDEWALAHGYASIVPTKVDLTAHELLDQLKDLESLI